ncbi:hypothetical protein HPB51_009661 [Rhipicephalus microplus]|uniref:Uncharacterized protein n=1 Tax=Rhipicephalus microplus TaxID=6941 RepID=A0A9J6ENZ3_RHIMP|nr:hypothetical protein HPB51_009661 [Rhipicephalus microplus]
MGDRTEEKARIASLTACLLALESEADAAKAAKERIKQQPLFSNSLLCALELSEKACDRSIWAFRRNEKWLEGTVPHLGEQYFKQSFRVYPSTFRFIVESLRSELERQCTSMRETIPPEVVLPESDQAPRVCFRPLQTLPFPWGAGLLDHAELAIDARTRTT